MKGNQILKTRMAESGFTQAELAEAVNADLRAAGYGGTVSDRTVRNWLTGKTHWPHHRQRAALEAVFNCPVTELGFAPRGGDSSLSVSAEAHAHRSLGLLRSEMRRTRAITTARLAQAQLGQGDLEPAVITAMSIPVEPTGQHPRVAGMLHDFGSTLRLIAPSSPHVRTWDEYTHDSRRKTP